MIEYTVKVDANGNKEWYLNDKLHREDGPAVEQTNGIKMWYKNGQKHRADGPAVEDADGNKLWYLNGEYHREDGPAIEYSDGNKLWFLNGEELTEQEFNKRTQVQELTIEQIEHELGYKIKVVGE